MPNIKSAAGCFVLRRSPIVCSQGNIGPSSLPFRFYIDFTDCSGSFLHFTDIIIVVFAVVFAFMTPKIQTCFRILNIDRSAHTGMDLEIVKQVYAAKEDVRAANELVRQYLPFIKSETAKFLGRIPVEGRDDELGIAMFAFHESAMAYSRGKGAFLKLAATAIRNRLIDYRRKEQRHADLVSLDQTIGGGEESRTLLEQLDAGHDEISYRQDRRTVREEIEKFARELSEYGLTLTDIAENCPRQQRTLDACHQVLTHARANPVLLEQLTATGRLPMASLSSGSGVERKTMERHRKYLVVALLLAFTNGFEIIRDHLRQMSAGKGGTT